MPWKVPAQVSASVATVAFAAKHLGADALDPARHFGGRAARKRHQQDAAGVGAIDDEVGNTMGERIRFARPGAGDDQEWPCNRFAGCGYAKFDGIALSIIQFFQIGRRHAEVPGKSLPILPLALNAGTDCSALRATPRHPRARYERFTTGNELGTYQPQITLQRPGWQWLKCPSVSGRKMPG